MVRLFVVSSLLFAAACNFPGAYLPDGGRTRQECSNGASVIAIKAQDLTGQPIGDAQVVAKNTTNGMEQVATTGGDGRTNQITDALGNGQVELTAKAGALSTRQPYIVQVLCGDCDCTVMPSSATLTLQ
ncbi:MAG: hypothetical protein IPJ65_16260 [Archangiaceae bacterium]|nr:hypothetical protein [Archangiaceae bacterium]